MSNGRERNFTMIRVFILVGCLSIGFFLTQNIARATYDDFCNSNSGSLDVPVAECEALVALYNATDGTHRTNTASWGVSPEICSRYGVTCTNARVSQLNVSKNNLTGPLPEEIESLTGLTKLYLNNNHLTSLPSSMGNLQLLTELNIGTNELDCRLPESVSNLTGLTNLYLGNNRILEGDMSLFSGMTNLAYLDLSWSDIAGDLANLSGLSKLKELFLQGNNHFGHINVLSRLTQLRSLSLGEKNNPLSGDLSDFSCMTGLTSLSIIGPINGSLLGDTTFLIPLTKLTYLRLPKMGLGGSLSALMGLTELTYLDLMNNNISGPLSALAGMKELTYLNVGYNFITGNPRDILGSRKLETFLLQANLLTGYIPPGLLYSLSGVTTGPKQWRIYNNHLEENYLMTQGYRTRFQDWLDIKAPTRKNQLSKEGGDLGLVGNIPKGILSGVIEYTIGYSNKGIGQLNNIDIQFPNEISLNLINSSIPTTSIQESKQYLVDGDPCLEDLKNETGVYAKALDNRSETMLGIGIYAAIRNNPATATFLQAPYLGQENLRGDYLVYFGLSSVFSFFGLSPSSFSSSCGKITPVYHRKINTLAPGEGGEITLSLGLPSFTGYDQQILLTGSQQDISLVGKPSSTSQYLQVYNASTGTDAIHFWIKAKGGPDLRSNELILQSIVNDTMSEREKALAIRRFVSDYKTHYPVYQLTLGDTGYRYIDLFRTNPPIPNYSRSPVEFINTLYGECIEISSEFVTLARLAGLEARKVGIQGHSVSEIKIDGKWSYIDADGGGVYFTNEQGAIYSAAELRRDPSILQDQYPATGPFYGKELYISKMAGYAGWEYPEGDPINENHRMDISLYPQDTLVYMKELDPIMNLVPMGKGILERHLSVENTTWINNNEFVFSEFFPYLVDTIQIFSSNIENDAVQTDISLDGGSTRSPLGMITAVSDVQYQLNTYQRKENIYAYKLRFSCNDCNLGHKINGMVIKSKFVYNTPSIPMSDTVDISIDQDNAQQATNLVIQKSSTLNAVNISAFASGELFYGELFTGNNFTSLRWDTLDFLKLQNTITITPDTGSGVTMENMNESGRGNTNEMSGITNLSDSSLAQGLSSDGDTLSSDYSGTDQTSRATQMTSHGETGDDVSKDIADNNELDNAYDFAFTNRLTTMPTMQQADMEGNLLRSHLAKMIVNFAIHVLHKTPNTGMVCNFTDMQNETNEMQQYMKLACQLGLMGVNADGTIASQTFNPQEIVDRGQFGTILSRLLRGGENDGGVVYYTKHLQALKATGLMKDISKPENKELRGRVMLMLMRASE